MVEILNLKSTLCTELTILSKPSGFRTFRVRPGIMRDACYIIWLFLQPAEFLFCSIIRQRKNALSSFFLQQRGKFH